MIKWAFILRTAMSVALLVTSYRETGWATALILSLILLRYEIEVFTVNKVLDNVKRRLEEMKVL